MRIPVAVEGWRFIVPATAAACILGSIGWWWAAAPFALFALGIIGEYLARMHFRSMERPTYVIDSSVGHPNVTEAVDLRQRDALPSHDAARAVKSL